MMSNLVPLDAEAGGRRQHRTASRTTGMSSRKKRRSDLEGNSQVDALTAGIKLHAFMIKRNQPAQDGMSSDLLEPQQRCTG